MILRTIASIEAEKFREETDKMVSDCYNSIPDNPIPFTVMPVLPVIFKPCREGKSLHSIVTRRSVRKQVRCQRWSDH